MTHRVLIVDDLEINRDILEGILEDDYDLLFAENGRQAVDIAVASQDSLSIILLDLMMPEMDGFAVLDELKARGLSGRIPVIIITGDTSIDSERRCFDYGIVDFVRKPFNGSLVQLRVRNAINLYSYKNRLEEQVAEQTAELRSQYLQLEQQAERLEAVNQKIIDMLGYVVEFRSLESGQHIRRVKEYTAIMAKEMMANYPEFELDEHKVEVMVSASALHDVGKVAIPDSILLKPGRFTPEEFEEMKRHTIAGGDLLTSIEGTWDEEFSEMCYEICRFHHERYDGGGYPDHLAGEEIPISAQIVSVADVYDALINKRCYKDPYSKEAAFNMIVNGECGVFSPKILDCFVKARDRFEQAADALA